MFDKEIVKAWLRQARADLEAAEQPLGGMKDCHRRYWLQQANEKCIKALGLIAWQGPSADEAAFKTRFLNKHSPLKNLKEEAGLPKSLWMLARQIETELAKLDGSGMLLGVDATTPTTSLTDTSYRYPFVDASGQLRAPADWLEADWDSYQGNSQGVIAALRKLLRDLENRVKTERGAK